MGTYTCPIRVHKYAHAHAQGQNARYKRAFNRETYDENALVRKIVDRLPDCCIRSLVAESVGGKDGGAEASFTEVELSRTAFATSFPLDFTSSRAISFARGSKTYLGLFSEKCGETFRHMCLRASALHICMHISRPSPPLGRNLFAINLVRNRTRYRESNSGAEKIWVTMRVSPARSLRMSTEKEATT